MKMSDLIERQSLIDVLEKEMDACNMPDEKPVRFGLRLARNFVQDMPSVVPKSHVIANVTFDEEKLKEICANALQEIKSFAQPERKMGKWVYNSPVTMKCNQCGLVIKDWDWHRFKYCPNCGADMRGKDNERLD